MFIFIRFFTVIEKSSWMRGLFKCFWSELYWSARLGSLKTRNFRIHCTLKSIELEVNYWNRHGFDRNLYYIPGFIVRNIFPSHDFIIIQKFSMLKLQYFNWWVVHSSLFSKVLNMYFHVFCCLLSLSLLFQFYSF